MVTTSRYFRLGIVALLVSVSAVARAEAQNAPQYVQSRPVEGSHAWDSDGSCYVFAGNRWVRDGYFRSFPVPSNRHLYDLFSHGQFLKRVDTSLPGWTQELPAAHLAASSLISWVRYRVNTTPTEANVQALLKSTNQWVSLAQLRAASAHTQPALGGGNPAGIVGGTTAPGAGRVVNPPAIPAGNPAGIVGGTTAPGAGRVVDTPPIVGNPAAIVGGGSFAPE